MRHVDRVAGIVLAFGLLLGPASAQEGCRSVQTSCTQMNANCERNCQSATNPSACAARICSVNLTSCKANGVWKPQGGAACWKTSNRS